MDSDIVFVMNAGELVEYGQPQQLLEDTDGYFYQLAIVNEDINIAS